MGQIIVKNKWRHLLVCLDIFQKLTMKGGFGKTYQDVGVARYYEQSGDNYANPHRYDIERLIKKKLGSHNIHLKAGDCILDLACGAGEATLPLRSLGYHNIKGIDPYTHTKYQQATGLECRQFTFVDILNGALDEQRYDAIVISYALHLVKESMLHNFCQKLAQISKKLLIISPHKFPVMKETFGWKEIENTVMDRIHLRVYTSFEFIQLENEEKEVQKVQEKIQKE